MFLKTSLLTGRQGRLYKALIEPKKAVQVIGLNFPFKDPGYIMFGAVVQKEGDLNDSRDTLIKTIEEFGNEAPTAEEVERSKTQIIKDIELTLNDPNRVGLGMSEYIAQGDWRLFFIQRDRVKAVTAADVQRVAQKYFKQSNRTLGSFVPTEKPERAEIPLVSDDEVAKIASEYKGGEKVAAGEAFDPSPSNIEARTTRSKIGGISAAMLPKENRGDTVFVNMSLSFGDEKEPDEQGDGGEFCRPAFGQRHKDKDPSADSG